MKTDFSPFGGLLKRNNSPLFSQEELVLTGFTHTPNNNNNNTNCMNNLTISPQEKLGFKRKRSFRKSYYSSKGLRILMILGLFLFNKPPKRELSVFIFYEFCLIVCISTIYPGEIDISFKRRVHPC